MYQLSLFTGKIHVTSDRLHTKFVLKVKRKADGSYDKHKARLVVRGFLAKMGVDFYATFSPMSSLISQPESRWMYITTSSAYIINGDSPMTSVANTVAMTTFAVHTLQPLIFYSKTLARRLLG